MRASVSARIFTGFVLVMCTFGAALAYSVYSTHAVRRRLELIGARYLELTLGLSELYTVQRGLLGVVAERANGSEASALVRQQVRLARQLRQRELRRALGLAAGGAARLAAADQQVLARVHQRLSQVEQAVRRREPDFDQLFGSGGEVAAIGPLGRELGRHERQVAGVFRRLRGELRAQVKQAAADLAQDQRDGTWIGFALMLLALAVGLTVTAQARRTLRPLRTLADGTRRIGAGDYGRRIPVGAEDELGRLARDFNAMAAALQEREERLIRSERMAAAGVLAAHITHEVRNPLNSIALNTELLEEELIQRGGGAATVEVRQLCGAIQREVDRLTGITEEYLRLARRPQPSRRAEDLNALVSSLIDFVAPELRQQGIRCTVNLATGLPPVAVDESQLRQALLNLLRNAAEALAGRAGQLSVSTCWVGSRVQVVIGDDGPGIGASDLPRIFEPFFTTKQGGTGLGLALTRQIVEDHGGTIEVRSVRGEGAVFALALPSAALGDSIVT
jgi:two-component system NtrC family sensor kinase